MWINSYDTVLPIDCYEIHIFHVFNKRVFALDIYYDSSIQFEYNYIWDSKLKLYNLGSEHNIKTSFDKKNTGADLYFVGDF